MLLIIALSTTAEVITYLYCWVVNGPARLDRCVVRPVLHPA
jgi:hypothetical protein